MRINRTLLSMVAVAVAAYAAGRIDWASDAVAAQDEPMSPEMQEMMMAWEKLSEPGPQHKALQPLIGHWEGTVRAWMAPDAKEPMEFPGHVKREWVLGGRFVKETITGEGMDGQPFEAIGYIGYNNLDGHYEFVWMESHSTGIYTWDGQLDPDRGILYTFGSYRMPDGKVVHETSQIDISSPGRQTFTGWKIGTDGRKFKSMEGEFERVSGR